MFSLQKLFSRNAAAAASQIVDLKKVLEEWQQEDGVVQAEVKAQQGTMSSHTSQLEACKTNVTILTASIATFIKRRDM